VWPPPTSIAAQIPAPTSAAWRHAQEYEFVFEDQQRALTQYEKIAATDSAATAHALTAAARCADKLGDAAGAARIRQHLLDTLPDTHARLRLGAGLQLAAFRHRHDQPEEAARIALTAVGRMTDATDAVDYAVAAHYLSRFDSLWVTLQPARLRSQLHDDWRAAHLQWQRHFAESEARVVLEESVLPSLLPSLWTLEPGMARHLPRRTPGGWQVWLLATLPQGGAAGGRLDLARIDSFAVASLENRMQQLGDVAVVTIVDTAGSMLETALADLRLSPPLSFRRLAILPAGTGSLTATWRLRLLRWSIAICVVGVLFGVWSGWRRVRREREEAGRKTDFVSNVSHELKTLLTTIRMYVDMLRLGRYENRAEADDYLMVVQEESRRLDGMVDRLLDVARIDRGGERHYDRSATDLATVVREAAQWLRRELGDAPLATLDVTVDAALPTVHFDREAMLEVLRNLVLNAVKYSPGPASVRLSLKAHNDGVALDVTDAGPGIAEGEQERIFERFYRVDNDLTRDIPGTGLGLSLVRDIVTGHDGLVSVRSQVGRGSTFTVWLPSTESET